MTKSQFEKKKKIISTNQINVLCGIPFDLRILQKFRTICAFNQQKSQMIYSPFCFKNTINRYNQALSEDLIHLRFNFINLKFSELYVSGEIEFSPRKRSN